MTQKPKETQVTGEWQTVKTIVKGEWIEAIVKDRQMNTNYAQLDQEMKIFIIIQMIQCHQLKDDVDE